MNSANPMRPSILLTIDVEDWFQVENFKQYIPFSTWPERELRVERNTHRLLDLFDSIEEGKEQENRKEHTEKRKQEKAEGKYPALSIQHPVSNKIRATFFVLGWIAERLPNLVKEIHSRGHEVASHGYIHDLCYDCSYDILRNDLSESKSLLEDITGTLVCGYRAPSFSINNDIIKIVEDCGYMYDSSYNSFGMHGRYGKLDLNNKKNKGIAIEMDNNFYELPVSNLQFSIPKFKIQNYIMPWGGGGYFRLIPFFLFRIGVASILRKTNAYMLYLHPWEIDADQPKIREASALFKFRHYVNLKKCEIRLAKIINAFRNINFITCRQYIREVNGEV